MSQFNKVLPRGCEGLGTVTLATLAPGTRRGADSWSSLASQHSPIGEPRSLSQNPSWMAPNRRDITRTPMHTHASAHTCAPAQTQNSKQSRCNERARLWGPKDCSADSSVCKDPESGTLRGTPLPIAQFHLDSLCVRYPPPSHPHSRHSSLFSSVSSPRVCRTGREQEKPDNGMGAGQRCL